MIHVSDYELICSDKGHVLALGVLQPHAPTEPSIVAVHENHAVLWRGAEAFMLQKFFWPEGFDPMQRLVVVEFNTLRQVEHLYDAVLDFEGGAS